MIRFSEAVLPGHPDKFCDLVADAIVQEATRIDRDAYAQVEVSVWSDQMWISGGVATSVPFEKPLPEIVTAAGRSIGLDGDNWIDASRYRIHSALCLETRDPAPWSHHVNDQCIIAGWAGYDAKVAYLPPEHFLALALRDALFTSCRSGALLGHGPDGKVLVRLREENDRFEVEHLLVTLQQKGGAQFLPFVAAVGDVLQEAYVRLQASDPRWSVPFGSIELLINPNGPLIQAGSDGDNGQTGRKLVADYYGPRIPLGGGALCGKHWTHIDRIGARAARQAAVAAVKSGARECLLRIAYAPGIDTPLDLVSEMIGRGIVPELPAFSHSNLRDRLGPNDVYQELSSGDLGIVFNNQI
ncbi:methionine adenosyltransferase domain-containing protein [Novosphingobium flavum]|uniref:methionine adenosyltransferase domain-containing protein n=1 Tax=Novosphingobium aerophilum TaxID=2839843 RepID=UPI00163A5754|nr:methionine adenosyltransferase domain-containing protein [Novosphingobium aerophilum]MBC2663783.1 methionine adenosyltransferase domain-containing protein [Novosphingobium aerophilum]